MMSDKKSVLILNQHAPYGTSNARDALDVALTCSIFEMPVSLAFLGDGLFSFSKATIPCKLAIRTLSQC